MDCLACLGLWIAFVITRTSFVPWFVILGFCSIHFTLTMARLKDIVLYTGDVVKSGFVISEFHCTMHHKITVLCMRGTRNSSVVLRHVHEKNFIKLDNDLNTIRLRQLSQVQSQVNG